MQFSLLNFLIGLPELNALAGSAANTGGGQEQGVGTDAFAELLGDIGAAGGDMQQGQQQTGGDLAQELVANLTVAQEVDAVVPVADSVDLKAINALLGHKISPEEAKSLLEQMDADAQSGEHAPEGLQELLESVEAGGTDVSVQDMLAQVPAADADAAEPRQNTLQRMMQWLQGALNPNAPLEALAYANAAAMFQDLEAPAITQARGREEEKEQPENLAELMTHTQHSEIVVFTPMVQQAETRVEALPEVELPEGNFAASAPTVTDAPILVATKHNSATHATSGKPDVMEDFAADLAASDATPMDVAAQPVKHDTDAQTTAVTQTQQTASADVRGVEQARTHHAHLAYQHSEVMEQVHVGVRHAIRDGVDRITIQLNPNELGRVEVKMDIVADGMSQVSFLVDKQETFDLLQRDARTLERMLQDAGVRADAGSMQFNLRQDSQSQESWNHEAANHRDGEGESEISNLNPSNPSELPTQMYVHLISDRVDIRA